MTEGTAVGCEDGICVLFVAEDEFGLERFDGSIVDGPGDSAIGICVLLESDGEL